MPWFNKHFSADILLLAAAHRKGDRRRHHGALQLPPKSRGAALTSTLWQQNLRELCQGKVGLDISKTIYTRAQQAWNRQWVQAAIGQHFQKQVLDFG